MRCLLFWVSSTAAMLGALACGGKVVVDAPGSGGGGATTTTWSSSSSTSSSSSGAVSCGAQTGDCSQCINCAADGPCAKAYSGAMSDEGQAFVSCFTAPSCQDAGFEPCVDACAAKFPQGFELFSAYTTCVECFQCVSYCQDSWAVYCPV